MKLVYQSLFGPRMKLKLVLFAYSRGLMKKNWFIKPTLEQKLRIGLPGLLYSKNEELVYPVSSRGLMKKSRFTRPPLDQERRRIALPSLEAFSWVGNEEELVYCCCRAKIIEELLYQAASWAEKKKNWSTRPPLQD